MQTSNDWWMSTKTNPKIFKRPTYQTDDIENYLMTCPVEVDPKTIGAELGLTAAQVSAVQRRLGLRKCVPNNPGCTSHIDMRGHNKPRKR